MNRVILVGRITKDPELRTSPNNVSFTAFSIAVNRIAPSPNGEREADFINCVAFNKQAENLCRFIKKGGQIGVEGKLQTRRYVAQDGSNRIATEVICDNIHFLEPKMLVKVDIMIIRHMKHLICKHLFNNKLLCHNHRIITFINQNQRKPINMMKLKNNLIFLMMTYHSRRKNIWQLLKGVKNLLFYRQ